MQKYLIAYDISNDKIRRQAAKLMEKHGQRLQRSVYIVDATKKEMHRVESILGKLLEANDKILVIPCCETCFANARVSTVNEPIFMAAQTKKETTWFDSELYEYIFALGKKHNIQTNNLQLEK